MFSVGSVTEADVQPPAVFESVTARVSVLPDVGSELLTVSDAAAVVSAAPAYEVGNGSLDVVGLSVRQSCLRMDSEDTCPALQDERSVMSFLVRPAAVLISIFFYYTMNVVMMDSHQGCVFVGPWSVTCQLPRHGETDMFLLWWIVSPVAREMEIPRARHRMCGK